MGIVAKIIFIYEINKQNINDTIKYIIHNKLNNVPKLSKSLFD